MQAEHNMTALQRVGAAVRANMLPGLVLWAGLAALLMAYAWSPAVQSTLEQWGAVKQAWGYPFAFASYAVFAVLVPEFLSRVVLRQPWPPRAGISIAFAVLVFGALGIMVDALYGLQIRLFGAGGDWVTVSKKMLFDQFVVSPFSNFAVVALFAWCDDGFAARTWKRVVSGDYLSHSFLPMMIAVWCVWIPGVLVIYCMPTALQFPVASLVLSFWVLIFKFMRKT
jgi:hypothetical protein